MKLSPNSPALPKPKSVVPRSERAFTRVELCSLVFSVLLLVSLALPALANKARSQQITCFNNLRQIGRAFHLWANDHDNLFPMYVPPSQGGSGLTPSMTTATWVQFGTLAKELGTPKILSCPADVKRQATAFSVDPGTGFFHQNFRNSAVSYFIAHPFWRDPADILSGDRNLRVDNSVYGCAVWGNSMIHYIVTHGSSAIWTNSIHVNMGHFLRADGRVEQLDNTALQNLLPTLPANNGNLHLLTP